MSAEQILTEVSLEWFTNTSASVGRYHLEEARAGAEPQVNHAPTGVAVFTDDFKSIRTFADRDNDNIVHWSEFDKGGYYASLEAPEVLVGDIRAFFTGLASRDARTLVAPRSARSSRDERASSSTGWVWSAVGWRHIGRGTGPGCTSVVRFLHAGHLGERVEVARVAGFATAAHELEPEDGETEEQRADEQHRLAEQVAP